MCIYSHAGWNWFVNGKYLKQRKYQSLVIIFSYSFLNKEPITFAFYCMTFPNPSQKLTISRGFHTVIDPRNANGKSIVVQMHKNGAEESICPTFWRSSGRRRG